MNSTIKVLICMWLAVGALYVGRYELLPDFYPRTIFVLCFIVACRTAWDSCK